MRLYFMPFIEVFSGLKGMDGGVLVFMVVFVLVVVVTFSGPLAQDPRASTPAQTRQTPMDFFMSPFYREQARHASRQPKARSVNSRGISNRGELRLRWTIARRIGRLPHVLTIPLHGGVVRAAPADEA